MQGRQYECDASRVPSSYLGVPSAVRLGTYYCTTIGTSIWGTHPGWEAEIISKVHSQDGRNFKKMMLI